MAQILNLRTHPERLRKHQEEALMEAFLPFEDSDFPPGVVQKIRTVIERASASRNKWTFVMLSPAQNRLVVDYLGANSRQPALAMRLWATCFDYLRTDTGEIMLTREELGQKLGTSAEEVSRMMGDLVTYGAIIRRRQRVPGLRGPGLVQYFMNPKVATHLGGGERDKAQNDAPLLRAIEGGRL